MSSRILSQPLSYLCTICSTFCSPISMLICFFCALTRVRCFYASFLCVLLNLHAHSLGFCPMLCRPSRFFLCYSALALVSLLFRGSALAFIFFAPPSFAFSLLSPSFVNSVHQSNRIFSSHLTLLFFTALSLVIAYSLPLLCSLFSACSLSWRAL